MRLILSVPQLTTPPVNTRVLAFLSSVAGDALTRHLGVILPAVMVALKEKLGTPDEQLVRAPRLPPSVSTAVTAASAGLETGSTLSAHVSLWLSGDGQLSGCDPLSRG